MYLFKLNFQVALASLAGLALVCRAAKFANLADETTLMLEAYSP